MTNLIEFFSEITGIDLDISNPVICSLVVIFGFIIVYDLIHIVFGSMFGFVDKF